MSRGIGLYAALSQKENAGDFVMNKNKNGLRSRLFLRAGDWIGQDPWELPGEMFAGERYRERSGQSLFGLSASSAKDVQYALLNKVLKRNKQR